MKGIILKLPLIFLFKFLLSSGVQAQHTRFIYIQTENKLPFYVKMNNRTLTSSASGYMIIPRLTDAAYKFVIGFQQNEWPEMNVTVNVQYTNAGFLLKNYGERGWGMVNLQTTHFLTMQKSTAVETEMEIKTSSDEFARVLAAVVNDPSIAEITVKKKAGETLVKTTEIKPEVKSVIQDVNKTDLANLNPVDSVIDKTGITIYSHHSTSTSLQITYIDVEPAGTDTIDILVPVQKNAPEIINKKEEILVVAEKPKVNVAETDKRFIDMELQNPNAKTDSGSVQKPDFVLTEKKHVAAFPVIEKQQTKPGLATIAEKIKTNCKKTATQNDFLKLRKQMAAEENEKKMIRAAGKQFTGMCFTTLQIKNLGVLFITEEERYKFYVAAFPYVSDLENYGILEDQLSDNYYKTRFKAMLSH